MIGWLERKNRFVLPKFRQIYFFIVSFCYMRFVQYIGLIFALSVGVSAYGEWRVVTSAFMSNRTLYNTGIAGPTSGGQICADNGFCIETKDYSVFFCYNVEFYSVVPCSNATWDPLHDFCVYATIHEANCTTKNCVDSTRMKMAVNGASFIPECVDPNGNVKLCGFFESNMDRLNYLADSPSDNFPSFFSSFHPGAGAQCKQAYQNWHENQFEEGSPELMTFDLF